MYQKDFFQRMIKLNQTFFENTFDVTEQFQSQLEKLGSTMLDQFGGMPEEGRKMYDSCLDSYKSARENFKTYMGEGYQQAEAFFK